MRRLAFAIALLLLSTCALAAISTTPSISSIVISNVFTGERDAPIMHGRTPCDLNIFVQINEYGPQGLTNDLYDGTITIRFIPIGNLFDSTGAEITQPLDYYQAQTTVCPSGLGYLYGKYKVYVEFVRYDGVKTGRFWYGGPGDRNRDNPNWGVVEFTSDALVVPRETLDILRIDVSSTRGGWESPLYRLNPSDTLYATVEITPQVEGHLQLVLKPFGDSSKPDITVQDTLIEGGIYTATIRNNWNAVGKYKLFATFTEISGTGRSASRYWFPYDEKSSTRGMIEFVSATAASPVPSIPTATARPTPSVIISPTATPTATATARPTPGVTVSPTPSASPSPSAEASPEVSPQPSVSVSPSPTPSRPTVGPLQPCEQNELSDGSIEVTLKADREGEAGYYSATPCEITIGKSAFSLSLDHMAREAGGPRSNPEPVENEKDEFYIYSKGVSWEKAQATEKCNFVAIGETDRCYRFRKTESPYYLNANERYVVFLEEFGFTKGVLKTGLLVDNNFRNGPDSFVKLSLKLVEEPTPQASVQPEASEEPEEPAMPTVVTTQEGVAQVQLSFKNFQARVRAPKPTEQVEEQNKILGVIPWFGTHAETSEVNDPGVMNYRLDDATGCLQVSKEESQESGSKEYFFNLKVKPLCGVCDSQNVYTRKITYSFARMADEIFEVPVRIDCNANVVFLTDLAILKHDSSLETALTAWIETLRSEGKGVWVVDLNDEKTMQNLGGLEPSSGQKVPELRSNPDGYGARAGFVKTVVNKTQGLSSNEYLVIGGGVDVIPMPALDSYNGLADGTPLDDYCYAQTNYKGETCHAVQDFTTAYDDFAVARMPTEKAVGNQPVSPHLLVKLLQAATEHRTIPKVLTTIGQQCGSLTPANFEEGCSMRSHIDTVVESLKWRTAYSTLAPLTCSETSDFCQPHAFEQEATREGIVYLESHGTGGTMAHSTAAIYSDTREFVEHPKDDPNADLLLKNGELPWQKTLTHEFLSSHELDGILLIHTGCFGGSPDYASEYGCDNRFTVFPENTPTCPIPMTAKYGTIMHAIDAGLTAAIGCTRTHNSGPDPGYREAQLLNFFLNSQTIGDAFDKFKKANPEEFFTNPEETRKSEDWMMTHRYGTQCLQFYGDPTIELVDV